MSLGDIIGELAKLLNNIFNFKRSGDYIKRVVDIYDAMHRVINNTDVQRILIKKIHNGGGLIKPGNDLYVSIVYESYIHPFSSMKDEYQRLSADYEYMRLISDVYEHKKITFPFSEMAEGILKNLYSREGVNYTEMYFIKQNKKELYLLSLSTAKDVYGMRTRGQQAEIQLAVNTIRNSLKA